MRIKQAILLVAGLATSVTYGGVCWTNGASLLLSRPLSNPFGLPQQTNCNIPLAPAPVVSPPKPPTPPAPVCPPCPAAPAPVTSWSTTTSTQTTTVTDWSTTTETSVSVSTVTDWSTTTETSTSTITSCTSTITSWGIDPAVAAAATAKCLAANPAQNTPVFNAAGKPRCCLPISTTGANALPTKIC